MRHVHSEAEMVALLIEGQKLRKTAATKMNSGSSRSHMVFAMLIEGTNKQTGVKTVGKLSLVDLAGSERLNEFDSR